VAPDLMDPDPETGKLSVNSKSGGNGGQRVGSGRSAGRTLEINVLLPSCSLNYRWSFQQALRVELLCEMDGLNSTDEAASLDCAMTSQRCWYPFVVSGYRAPPFSMRRYSRVPPEGQVLSFRRRTLQCD